VGFWGQEMGISRKGGADCVCKASKRVKRPPPPGAVPCPTAAAWHCCRLHGSALLLTGCPVATPAPALLPGVGMGWGGVWRGGIWEKWCTND
jgi:hypothetical protein